MLPTTDPAIFVYDMTVVRENPGLFSVKVENANDRAGNAIATISNASLKVDPNAAATNLSYSRGPNGVTTGPLVITATFSKPIVSTPLITIAGPAGPNAVASASMTRVSSWVFVYLHGIVTGNDGVFAVSIADARDVANLIAGPAANASLVIDTTPPSATVAFARNPAVFGAGVLKITATFTEALAPGVIPRLAIEQTSGFVYSAAADMTPGTTLSVWTITRTFTADN
ncbi:MAG: hypothetical protein FD127_4459, partial [Acidimicrobiaceae bacterium]